MTPFRVRPHLILLAAAALLLLTAHWSSKEYTAPDEILVSSSFMPVVVLVSTQGETRSWTMGPFQDVETGMHGPANVTIAPAIPGTALLITHGPTAAFVPLAALTCIAALLFKIHETRTRRIDARLAAPPRPDRLPQKRETTTERKR